MGSTDHTIWVPAMKEAGIEFILANCGQLTVFAPANSAFEKLQEKTLENLLKTENVHTLTRNLMYFTAPGTFKGDLLNGGKFLLAAMGDNVMIKQNGEELTQGKQKYHLQSIQRSCTGH